MIEIAKGIAFPSAEDFNLVPELGAEKYTAARNAFEDGKRDIVRGYKFQKHEENPQFGCICEINEDAPALWGLFWDIADALLEGRHDVYCVYGFKDSEEFSVGDYMEKSLIKSVLEKYEYSIVNDGFLSVGIAADKGTVEEILIDSFKFIRVFTSQREKLVPVLEMHGIFGNPGMKFIDEFLTVSETVADATRGIPHPEEIIRELDAAFRNEGRKDGFEG